MLPRRPPPVSSQGPLTAPACQKKCLLQIKLKLRETERGRIWGLINNCSLAYVEIEGPSMGLDLNGSKEKRPRREERMQLLPSLEGQSLTYMV